MCYNFQTLVSVYTRTEGIATEKNSKKKKKKKEILCGLTGYVSSPTEKAALFS